MRDVYIIAVGMTRFGKHLDKSEKDLVAEAFARTMDDAPEIKISDIQSAFFANTAWGFFTMQHSIKGQVAMRPLGIEGIPITNVENACACASTALHCAYKDVASGMYECSLAIGMEKLYNEDKAKSMMAFNAGIDVSNMKGHMKALRGIMDGVKLDIPEDDGGAGAGKTRSAFMDVYAKRRQVAYGHLRDHPAPTGSNCIEEPLPQLHEPQCPVPEDHDRGRSP